jgi:predicted TIM-barrel fold metal-dependent hydrolase
MLDRLPKLKIITHHLGAMAPFFINRIGYGMDQFGARTADEDYEGLRKRMKKRPVDYFRMFYADTAIDGSSSAIRCGLDFYATKRVLFGTDCPSTRRAGRSSSARRSRPWRGSSCRRRTKVYFGNSERMLRLKLPKEKRSTMA